MLENPVDRTPEIGSNGSNQSRTICDRHVGNISAQYRNGVDVELTIKEYYLRWTYPRRAFFDIAKRLVEPIFLMC